jgi:hypothetical protein
MADFVLITMEVNVGNTGAPVWSALGGANTEVRWSDSNAQSNVLDVNWPAMIRPAATAIVNFTYAFTAAAVGEGVYSGGGVIPPVYSEANYLWARWNWDAIGTFASAPIFTAYPTIAHGAIVAADGSMLGGSVADTGSRSYLKGNAFGQEDSAGAPAAGPLAPPAVGDGAVGALSPVAGANWMANFQSLQGDNDWILSIFTPAAATADTWSLHFALFTGPNETPALYLNILCLRYTWI